MLRSLPLSEWSSAAVPFRVKACSPHGVVTSKMPEKPFSGGPHSRHPAALGERLYPKASTTQM
jgi:hypothetical protein